MSGTGGSVPRLRFPGFGGEWGHLKLGELGPVSMCKRIMKEETNTTGDVPFYKIGTFGKEPDAFISTELYAKFKKKYPYPKVGDILISAAGTIGRLVIFDGSPAYFQDSNIVWVANGEEKVSNAFLFHCYENTRWTTENTTIARLYNDNLRSLRLVAPSLPEQKKIAAFLGAVDAKIAALRARVLGLQTYKRGLMQSLFSQTLRFTQPDGTAFPEWEEKRLGEVATRCKAKNGDLQYMRVLTNSAAQGVVDQGSYFDKDIANAENLGGYYIVKLGDFVYNPRISVTAPVGPIKRNDVGDGVMSPLYTVFRFKEANTDFFNTFFETTFWHDYMKSVANYGARHDRMAISMGDFMDMPLPFPHPEEQAKIVEALSAMDAKISAVQAQVDRMQDFKKGLLQQMFV
ncbi:restriction endonuclease subunit S [Frigidibacter sp. RF13]|uniref:restriction endonuclease subunit S n=1 Tax=Frigidibacter sp. RF13 TaxID=2997340 RepID=UPI00226E3287|nr:restriction endonuclease subunit S [Frigidibacter sp. RF13]MCY1128018.1 restriction endonuclease subunit S [Frigidibacter sp. RF13]